MLSIMFIILVCCVLATCLMSFICVLKLYSLNPLKWVIKFITCLFRVIGAIGSFLFVILPVKSIILILNVLKQYTLYEKIVITLFRWGTLGISNVKYMRIIARAFMNSKPSTLHYHLMNVLFVSLLWIHKTFANVSMNYYLNFIRSTPNLKLSKNE